MITSVTIWSYEQMKEAILHRRLPREGVIISITDPEDRVLFPVEASNVLTFQFHDVEPEWFDKYSGWTEEQVAEYRCFTQEDALRTIEFLTRHHRKPEPCPLFVNCMAGISRSGAVGLFAHRMAATDRAEFERTNRGIHPNGHVLRLLMRNWYGREWPELEG